MTVEEGSDECGGGDTFLRRKGFGFGSEELRRERVWRNKDCRLVFED